MIEKYALLTGVLNFEQVHELCENLNKGYEILHISTAYIQMLQDGKNAQCPSMIAILVKRTSDN